MEIRNDIGLALSDVDEVFAHMERRIGQAPTIEAAVHVIRQARFGLRVGLLQHEAEEALIEAASSERDGLG